MNIFIRWGRFNLVGVAGMAVQLGVLAVLNRLLAGHYMVATAAAIEITLIHNFVWHVLFTWRDRFPTQDAQNAFWMGKPNFRGALVGQCLRFHLSNGLVSMIGNLALMPVLVAGMRIPVLEANAIAIVCCSIVNFVLGDRWAFVDFSS